MKKVIMSLVVIVLVGVGSSSAVEVYDSNYKVETYVSYYQPAELSRGMTFDSQGNLYVTYSNSGTIDCITPQKNITQMASGLNDPRSVVWTGGSSYGEYLYVTNYGTNQIKRVSLEGVVSEFSTGFNGQGLALDRVGNYGNNLFTATRGGTPETESMYRILPSGEGQLFSYFSYGLIGGPTDIAFDSGNQYGGFMYVTVDSNANNVWSGISRLDMNGNPTRIAHDIISAHTVEFDVNGNMFGGQLFVSGSDQIGQPTYIWCISPSGEAVKFAEGTISQAETFAFGPDGALYVHEAANNTVTISRITPVPEPTIIILLGLGSVFVARYRNRHY